MKTILIIPAYNEGESIERVVRNVAENYPQYDYIVVNDGSTDNTAKVCMRNGFIFWTCLKMSGCRVRFRRV